MQVIGASASFFALFGFGGGEAILILALLIILFGARKLPEIVRGFGEGISEFRRALRNALRGTDQEAEDAGKSFGGIYGKPAAQALTPDNRTAELYDPAALRDKYGTSRGSKPAAFLTWSRLWRWIRHFVFKRRK
jgi:sec-independent protein translocase protein TatA